MNIKSVVRIMKPFLILQAHTIMGFFIMKYFDYAIDARSYFLGSTSVICNMCLLHGFLFKDIWESEQNNKMK